MNRLRLMGFAPLAFATTVLAQEAGHVHAPSATSTTVESGSAGEYAADRYFDPKVMAHAREMVREEMGGMQFSKVMLTLAEYLPDAKGDGYRWDGQAWFGGDVHRLVIRSEGEGGADGLETADVQALYSRAVGRYTDVQFGSAPGDRNSRPNLREHGCTEPVAVLVRSRGIAVPLDEG